VSRHTPAPWTVDGLVTKDLDVISPDGRIAMIDCDDIDAETLEANARLIAASPDLLDACRCALADLEGLAEAECFSLGDPAHLTIKELRAAIIKATGEAV